MKRIVNLLWGAVIILCMLSACGTKESPAEDFDYTMIDGEITITGYHGSDREISIPSKINGRPVTTIGEKAFEKYDMTEIRFPKTLTTIGKAAFAGCNCLTVVEIPGNVKVIADDAFSKCQAITKVVISMGVERIEEDAFQYCTSLKEVSLPDSLLFLGRHSFLGCESLKELVIPDVFDGFEIRGDIIDIDVSDPNRPTYSYGDLLQSPVGIGDETVLVVKKGSPAEQALERYGYGKTNYRVR